ncbi:polyprenyl synthetase family protein [Dietzia aerolata]|uniref:Polyprenyl synthetase family protein n=2 Tax=Dietzia aerolata TaxID=595984 RepID=A0ABV5JQY8_9ACTN
MTAVPRMAVRDVPAGLGSAVDDWVADIDATTRTGKGIRSALLEAVYVAAGGDDPAVRIAVGEALELLHEAFLIHDDVVDGDDHRRGQANLQGRTRDRVAARGAAPAVAEGVGRAGGLLGGDMLLVAAMSGFARLPVPAPTVHRVLDEVERAVTASVAGEYADIHYSADARPPSRERALAIGQAKTAAYSVSLPLVLGAILAGAEDQTVESLREVGAHLGTAYQVVDDLLGVFGDPGETGKSNEGDLLRGAPTVLLAFAATTDAWPRIDAALGGHGHGDPDPDSARDLLYECGARDHAQRVAEDLVAAARTALDRPTIPAAIRAALAPHLAAALERTR